MVRTTRYLGDAHVRQSCPAEQVAEALLRIGAVQLRPSQPFTFASGMRSPTYTDNRLLCSAVPERRLVSGLLARTIEKLDAPVDVIAGTATAGIPHAAWCAELLGLPMVYVRGSAKDHGTGRRIEGRVAEGQRAVLVEDLISTGGSALSSVQALREEGNSIVEDCVAICTYGFPRAVQAFADAGVAIHALCDFPTIVSVAVEQGYLSADQRELVLDWCRDPAAWGARVGVA